MITLRSLPIQTKLIAMMMLTASIGILALAVVITINEAVSMRHDIKSELETLAQVIGSRSTGSLTFNDPRTANENLSALAIKKDIIYAAIYQEDGVIFAEYKPVNIRNNSRRQPNALAWRGLLRLSFMKRLWGSIDVIQPINFENKPIGRVFIQSDASSLITKMSRYLGWVVTALLACFGLSFLVSSRLHQLISTRVLALQTATRRLTREGDYSVRIPGNASDELGELIISFNAMLEQIEIRDRKLDRYSKHLESLVDERTDELTEANDRRIQWLENMARFLKHELKNASIGVKSSLDLIERRSQDVSIAIYLDRAKKSLNYMNILLTSVSNASNLEAMIYKEPLMPLDFSSLVHSQIEEYGLSFPQFHFVSNIASGVNVMGNEDRLRQLMANLLNNAIEHSHLNAPITIGLLQEHGQAELTVSNHGVNLPAEKEKMFDLFVSLRDAGHWKSDNLGLGLYLVKLIAEGHGGWVRADDLQETEGAVFTVGIPLLSG